MSTPNAIIFDMDGVITDTEPLHKEAELLVCREHGLAVDESEWDSFKGKTAEDIFSYLLRTYAPERTDLSVPEIIARKTEIYIQLGQKKGLPVVPGAIDFIGRVKQYFDWVALATSSNQAVQQAAFDRYGLWPHFDVIVTGDAVTHGKPDPEIYRLVTERLAHPAERCLVLEDSDNGVRSAVAAGCLAVGITTSFPAERLRSFGAAATVDSFEELERRLAAGDLIK